MAICISKGQSVRRWMSVRSPTCRRTHNSITGKSWSLFPLPTAFKVNSCPIRPIHHRATKTVDPHQNSMLSPWLGVQATCSTSIHLAATRCCQVETSVNVSLFIYRFAAAPHVSMTSEGTEKPVFSGKLHMGVGGAGARFHEMSSEACC